MGNSSYQSPIAINVDGSVFAGGTSANDVGSLNAANLASAAGSNAFLCQGCLNSAAIYVSGGTSGLAGGNGHGDAPNRVSVGSTGSVTVASLDFSAIYATYGHTNVEIAGVVTGGIVLGDTLSDPALVGNLGDVTIATGGIWTAGTWNVVAQGSVHNYGLINIVDAAVINGSMHHYEGASLNFHIDQAEQADEYLLRVNGNVHLEGTLTPVLSSLLPGEMRLLKADTLTGTPVLQDPTVFNWTVQRTDEGGLHLAAAADFTPVDMVMTQNHVNTAKYLDNRWQDGDLNMGGYFAHMLNLASTDEYREVLGALSGAEVLHHEVATVRTIPALMSNTIDCKSALNAQFLRDRSSCAWLTFDVGSGQYSGGDTQDASLDTRLVAVGMQKQFALGWFMSGAFGYQANDVDTEAYRGSGDTYMAALGIQRLTGPWAVGGAVGVARGSFEHARQFATPSVGDLSSAPSAHMRSESDLNLVALQTQASYTLDREAWYLQPSVEMAAMYLDRSGFQETAAIEDHLLRLRAQGSSDTYYAVTPRIELGGRWDVTDGIGLNAFVNGGMRFTPWTPEVDLQFSGAADSDSWFINQIERPLEATIFRTGINLSSVSGVSVNLAYEREDSNDFRIEAGTFRIRWEF